MMTDSTSMTTPMTTPMVTLEGHDSKMAEKADMSGVMEKGEMMTQEGEEEDPHAAAGHGGHGVRVSVSMLLWCVWYMCKRYGIF